MDNRATAHPVCADCGATPVRTSGQLVCSRCRYAHRCPVCGFLFPDRPRGSWCQGCTDMMAEWNLNMALLGISPPPPDLAPFLVDYYTLRKERNLPLWDTDPSSD